MVRCVLMLVALSACGGEAHETAPTPVAPPDPPQAPPEPPMEATNGAYDIHEWGLVGTMLDGERALAVAGSYPLERRARTPLGDVGHASGGKPVLYVHLRSEVAARFDLTLQVPGGRVLESWPTSTVDETTIRFSGVTARAGACALLRYPVKTSPTCATADGYCEAAELRRYETGDSACLEVGGERYNHLFYRADLEREHLPLRIEANAGGVTITNAGAAALAGPVIVIRGRSTESDTLTAAIVEPPAPGESTTVVRRQHSVDARDASDALAAALAARGMTEDEVSAFMRAWRFDLFGHLGPGLPGSLETAGTPPPELARATNAVLYFLPDEVLARAAPLTFSPAPTEVKRAIVVRVNLGERR